MSSKEEFLKIQKCVLKVNIHCDGCKQKVKKILQKIDGVFTTDIDADQGKVTVSGNVDPGTLIKKLTKSGKHAELWGAPKSNQNNNQNQNQNHLANQFKNMQIDNGKGGNNNKSQKGGNNNNNQPKGGQNVNNQQQQQQQQQQHQQQLLMQQLMQQHPNMKGLQDLKLPQLKGMQMGPNKGQNPNQKAVKFSDPLEEDDLSDEDYYDDDDDFEDEDYDDDMDDIQHPLTKNLKQPHPGMGNGQVPGMMMNFNANPHLAQLMSQAQKAANNGGGNGKKGGGGGGGGPVPVQVNGPGGGGGKKGGGGGGGNNGQNPAGGGKNGPPSDGKKGNNGGGGGGGNNKSGNGNGGGGNGNNGNGGKKGGGGGGLDGVQQQVQAMNNKGFQHMGPPQQGMPGGASMGHHHQMGNMNMGQMGQIPMGQMGQIPAVQGLPATSMNGAGGGYFQGAGPEVMPGNPYHQQQLQQQQQQQQQQQYLAAVMNQQRAMAGNERFQPMMYARPPPAVNYMPPYPYHPHQAEPQYAHFFSDENTSSCNVM